MPKSMHTSAYRSLQDALMSLRRQASVSQIELSERLGKPQSFVSNVERGGRRIDLVEFYAIVRALGGDPAKVFAELTKAWPEKVAI